MCYLRELQVTSMCHLRDLMEIRSHLGTSTAMTDKMSQFGIHLQFMEIRFHVFTWTAMTNKASQCSADWYMVAMVPEMVPAMVPEI